MKIGGVGASTFADALLIKRGTHTPSSRAKRRPVLDRGKFCVPNDHSPLAVQEASEVRQCLNGCLDRVAACSRYRPDIESKPREMPAKPHFPCIIPSVHHGSEPGRDLVSRESIRVGVDPSLKFVSLR